MIIDLNSDLGEGFGPWAMGDDGAMMEIVSTANIACGFHAGDPDIMRRTTELARSKGVAVGAHPGFNDLKGFGRRAQPGLSLREVENLVAYQVGAFQALSCLAGHPATHVKAHGALGNACNDDDELALAVGRGIKAADPKLLFMVMPALATERAAERLGLAFFREIYADRTYDDSFNLTDRRKPGSVIHDPDSAADAVLRMVGDGEITSINGKRLKVGIDSVCVHGDNPAAVALARTVRTRLEAAGWTIAPYWHTGNA
jgi:UPF0271 protein